MSSSCSLEAEANFLAPAFLLPILLWGLLFLSCGTAASPRDILCADVTSGGAERTQLVTSDGAILSGCELINTSLTLLVLLDSTSTPSPAIVPIRFSNMRGQESSVTIRLLSTQVPTAGSRTSIEVVVENCTLMRAADAFLVDVHNATGLNEVNLTVRDSTILNATRGAASVYRSALAVGAGGTADAAALSVWISVERSTVEVVGPPLGTRCGSDTVPGDYRNPASALVPVLCPVFAASVLLTAPDTPTAVSVTSVFPLNATKVGIVTKDSNVTVQSLSGSDSFAASVVRTAQGGPSVELTSVSIEVTTSAVLSVAGGGMAAGGSLVLTDRMPKSVMRLEHAVVRIAAADSRVVGQDRDGQVPATALGLCLFGRETVRLTNCTVSFEVADCELSAHGGPLVGATGIVLYSSGSSSISQNTISLVVNRTSVGATGSGGYTAVASTGIALYSHASGSSGGITSSSNNSITLLVNECNVTATQSGNYAAVTSGGIALYSYGTTGSNSSSDSNTIILFVNGSNVTTTGSGGYAAVTSAGIALYSYSDNSGTSSASSSSNTNITLLVSGCNVTATESGNYAAVSSIGIALSSFYGRSSCSSSSGNNITLLVNGCSVSSTLTGSYAAVSGVGIASYSQSGSSSNSSSRSNNITLVVDRCTAWVTGSGGYAAVSNTGIALYSYGDSSNSSSNRNNISLLVNDCRLVSIGDGSYGAVSSIGIVLYSSGISSSGSSSCSNKMTLLGNACHVTATGIGNYAAVSSMGIALSSFYGRSGGSKSSCNNFDLQASGSNVTATASGGYAAVSSAAMALFSNSDSSNSSSDRNNVTLTMKRSNLTATGSANYVAISSLGVALFSYTSSNGSNSSSTSSGNNITLVVKRCNVAATGSSGSAAVSSMGIALYSHTSSSGRSSDSSCNGNNVSLLVKGTNVGATVGGSYAAVSSTAIALFGFSESSSRSSCVSNSNEITHVVDGCNVTATGMGSYVAVSSTGIAQFSGGISSSGSASNNNYISLLVNVGNLTATGSGGSSAISSSGIALYSSGSTIFSANTVLISIVASTTSLATASTLSCGTSLGLCVNPSSPPSSLAANVLRIQACNVSITIAGEGSQSALGSIPLTSAALSLSNVSITSTASTTSPVSCLSFVPANASAFDSVKVNCPTCGWAPGLVTGFAANVHLQRMILNGTAVTGQDALLAQVFLPGLLPDAFTASTNDSIAAFSAVKDACAMQLWQWGDHSTDLRSVTRSTTDFSSSASFSYPTPTYATLSITPFPSASSSPSLRLSSSGTIPSPTKAAGCCLQSKSRPSSTPRSSESITISSHRAVVQPPSTHHSPLSRILGEQAAIGVTTASITVSVVWSSVFSSGAVTRVPIMRSLASSIRCAWVEQELDDHPSYLDLPLQFVSVGDHPKLRYYAGGVVLSGLFVLLWELVCFLCFKILQGGRVHRRVESMLGIGSVLWQGYLVPNVAQAAVIVFWHAGGVAVAATAVVALFVVGYSVVKWLWVLLPAPYAAHAPPIIFSHSENGRTVKIKYSTGNAASQSWLRFFGPMFDGTVDPRRMICRVVVMEEVAIGVLLSILAGIKPEHDESCRYTAASMLAVTVLHFLYLVAVRPYRTRLDAMFASINAFLIFAQGVLAVIITVEGVREGPLLTGFGALGLAQLLLLFLQFIVGGFYFQMLQSRRRILQREVDTAESDGVSRIMVGEVGPHDGPNLESPLLMAPQGVVESNPLANSNLLHLSSVA